MNLRYRLRHRQPYRTRIQFSGLRNKPQLCKKLEGSLSELDGVSLVEVRPVSGSIILCHPQRCIAVDQVISVVASEKIQAFRRVSGTACNSKKHTSCSKGGVQSEESVYHVSGFWLVTTGLYLAYLYIKRVALFAVSPPNALFLSLPVITTLALSLPIQRQALDNLKKTGKPDMGLISTALLYVSLLTGNVLSSFTVFWLFNLSGWLESKIKTRTRQTIRDMFSVQTDMAWLLIDGCEVETAVRDLKVDDTIVLRFGHTIPVDGVIVEGEALINESTLTGEAVPASKVQSDSVLAGTMVLQGEIWVRVTKTGEQTRLAAIIRLIENAEKQPGELQLTSRRFSQMMVPVSLSLAGAVFIFTGNLVQAMAVLIITCPCALRLSTSVAISRAMARAAEDGVLVKGGRFIETAGRINTLVVDKTGTLTLARSAKVEVDIFDKRYGEKTLIQLAASMQKVWPHPLGQPILGMAEKLGAELLTCRDAEFFVGRGVKSTIDGQVIVFGSRRFLQESGIEGVFEDGLSPQGQDRCGQLYLAKNDRLLAGFSATQIVRDGVEEAIVRLRRAGVTDLTLLTGDVQSEAEELAEKLGFDRVQWQQSPEDKASWITSYRKENEGRVLAMVGDGVNDTPAFAASDLSISIADGGSDITVEYSDVVLQSGGLEKVADLIELGKATDARLKQSYTIAIGLNLITLLGSGFGLIAPVAAALFHNVITILAVGNAATIQGSSQGSSDTEIKNQLAHDSDS